MTCPKCGYNPDKLTEYMKTVIPVSKIEARIIEIEGYPLDHWACYDDHNDMLIQELKDLLPPQAKANKRKGET